MLQRKLICFFSFLCALSLFPGTSQAQQDFGSGFIIHPDGYVLTQKRAGQGGGKIEVVLADGSRHTAKAIAVDSQNHFAILKISAEGLSAVPLGDSTELDVMDPIIALGFPQASDADLSAFEGKINARRKTTMIPLFQVDLAIEPGHYGGPVINEYGEAIGMIISRSEAASLLPSASALPERINYAIPTEALIGQIQKLVPEPIAETSQQEKLSPKQIYRNLKSSVVKVCNYSAPIKTAKNSVKTLQIPLPDLPAGAKPLDLVLISPGSFNMGNPSEAQNRESNEAPLTQVSLTRPFYLGKYEITQAQWVALMGSNPSHFTENPNLPVERISWYDAVEFCQRLSELLPNIQAIPEIGESMEIRLPFEAEWEYACRASTATPYFFGFTLKTNQANFDGRSFIEFSADNAERQEAVELAADTEEYYLDQTSPVGQFPANAWGLYDMHGNVQEWCMDRYAPRLPGRKVVNPQGPSNGIYRICRGGSWFDRPQSCRSSSRNPMPPSTRLDNVGFRVVLSAK
jgi:formylglycine-generating enzyme required for sulfatase activity